MWAILVKDLRIELRSGEGVGSLVVLGLLVLLVFELALPGEPGPEAASAALWLSFVFAGTLGVQRTWLRERDNLALQGLLAAPVDPGAIYLAKLVGNVLLLVILQLVIVPVAALFFTVDVTARPLELALVLLLGNVGFSSLATLFAAVSAETRAREVLLPLLLFPLVVPVLLAAVETTSLLLGGGSVGAATAWLEVLVASDVVFVTAGWLLFETVIRE